MSATTSTGPLPPSSPPRTTRPRRATRSSTTSSSVEPAEHARGAHRRRRGQRGRPRRRARRDGRRRATPRPTPSSTTPSTSTRPKRPRPPPKPSPREDRRDRRPVRGVPRRAALPPGQVVRHPLLRRLRAQGEGQHRAAQVDARGEEDIYQVEVPMEDVVEIKNGQRKMVTRVRIPGYVLVRMELNEDTWSVVRHTPGVTGFVGNAHNPTPLRFEEAFNMLKSLVEIKEVAPAKGAAAKGGQRRRAQHPRRGRLRGRRDHHDQGRLVRGSARHDQRDQARERQAHGARLALRARDPGRAQLRPGHQALTQTSRGSTPGEPLSGNAGRAGERPVAERVERTLDERKRKWHRRRR